MHRLICNDNVSSTPTVATTNQLKLSNQTIQPAALKIKTEKTEPINRPINKTVPK